MIDGSMQSYGLTLDKFLSHAAKWHPDAETVSAGADGSVARIGYAALEGRARAGSGAPHAMGVRAGHRVATPASTTTGHSASRSEEARAGKGGVRTVESREER